MKKALTLLIAIVLIMYGIPGTAESSFSRILIVCFSRAGENYNVGKIEKGNTEKLAEIIMEQTGGDLFRIETVIPYPESYDETLDIATREYQNNERPELTGQVENWEDYDIVFLGYPIWWAGLPMALHTFMESYDWQGKTVIPFNTHEGSGQAGTQQVIEDKLSGATVLQGLAVRGSKAQNDAEGTAADVAAWLKELGLK